MHRRSKIPIVLVLMLAACGEHEERSAPPAATTGTHVDTAAMRLWVDQLLSNDTEERQKAAEALATQSSLSDEAVAALITAVGSANASVAGAAQSTLTRRGAGHVDRLVEGLGARNPSTRAGLLQVLGRLGAAATPALDRIADLLANDSEWTVRYRAAEALRRLAPAARSAPAVVPALRAAAAGDSDPNVRSEAQAALDAMGTS